MAKKAKASKSLKSGGAKIAGGIKSAAKAAGIGSKSAGGRSRRSKGPAYWANKVVVQKLKKKYFRLKYGSV